MSNGIGIYGREVRGMSTLKKGRRISEKLKCVVLEGQGNCLYDCVRDKYVGNSQFYDRWSCYKGQVTDSWMSTKS